MKTVIFSLVAFVGINLLAAPWFEEERTYRHHLFIDQKTCQEQQAGHMWMNCFQWLTLYPDGTAMVVLTDIANEATYKIEDNTIQVYTEYGDAPKYMMFSIDNTGRNLILNESNSVWELEQ